MVSYLGSIFKSLLLDQDSYITGVAAGFCGQVMTVQSSCMPLKHGLLSWCW